MRWASSANPAPILPNKSPSTQRACGGAYVVAAKVGMTAVGLTGIPGMAIVQPMSLIHYVIGLVIAFGAAFAASYLLKYKVE